MPDQQINQTKIYQWICEQSPEGGRVLDIGCGRGELLAQLVSERGVRGVGIEISENCVVAAVQRGLSVHHGNFEEGMDHYEDNSFDVVVLSVVIQEMHHPTSVMREAFRIGKRVLVVFPNFGYWRVRWQLAMLGQAPRTKSFPATWYDSPNCRYFTIADWENLIQREGYRIVESNFLTSGQGMGFLPNLRAEVAMYLLEDRK